MPKQSASRLPRCMFFLLVVCLLHIGLAALLHAEQPPTAPMLRIETGMHTALILRIGVDTANRYLVTGSYDKTVRVWELATGRLLQTLRLPIGEGNEGKINAVAISPDGKTVACGGLTGYEWEKSYSIYLFDRESGRLLRRITGLPSTIQHLAYAPDGHFLVATLWGKNGIRIYRTADYTLVAKDEEYGDGSSGAAFDRTGRLVTTSWDGFIRLYDRDFRLSTKRKAPGGNTPFSVSFSPDSSKVAVGFHDSTRVDVLAGSGLSHLYSPDTSGVDNGNLYAVSWSLDGRFLYAGGTYSVQGTRPIRKWSDGGRGQYTGLPAADNTITHILPLNNGGIVFSATDPAFGVFDANNHRTIYQRPATIDHRSLLQPFLLSQDGATVQFGGEYPACFSLMARTLISLTCERSPSVIAEVQRRLAAQGFDSGPANGMAGSRTTAAIRAFQHRARLPVDGEITGRLLQALGIPTLTPPRTTATGLNIADWKNTYTPKLNGRALQLAQYETSRSLAIAPDEKTFLLGTESRLRLFDRNGNETWKVPVPGAAWRVNISGNGRLAVAAFGDGTIRWYRLTDGKELLTLFPHRDGKRWVLWIPEGFFDASAGGETLIGYHLNRGREQAADFVGVAQLYNLFYRPDLVAKRLAGEHEPEILAQLRKIGDIQAVLTSGLPPVVELLAPPQVTHNRWEFTLDLKLTDQGGGIGRLVYRINGVTVEPLEGARPVDISAPGGRQQGTIHRPVTLQPGPNTITVTAYNAKNEIESRAVTITINVQEPPTEKPSLYVLAIGIDNYRDRALQTPYAVADARAMAEEMQRRGRALFKAVHVLPLVNEQATRQGIEAAFKEVVRGMQRSDVFVLYLAGHGLALDGEYYFIPQDLIYENQDAIRTKALGQKILRDFLGTVPALKGLVILDTCNAGALTKVAWRGVTEKTALDKLMRATGRAILAASSDTQMALAGHQGHGVFTYVLLEGLRGKADSKGNGNGETSIAELAQYASDEVPRITKERWGYEQFPMYNLQGMSFPIGLTR